MPVNTLRQPTELESLTRAVCATPDDDLPRLVLADWLDENGKTERAEFIRVQVELLRIDADVFGKVFGRIKSTTPDPLVQRHSQLKSRERELWPLVRNDILFGLPGILMVDHNPDGAVETETHIRYRVSRGFVSAVELHRLNQWTEHISLGWFTPLGPVVVDSHPVERVTCNDKIPQQVDREFVWWDINRNYPYRPEDRHELPAEVFAELWVTHPKSHRNGDPAPDSWRWCAFPTAAGANVALSFTLISLARAQPALPCPTV